MGFGEQQLWEVLVEKGASSEGSVLRRVNIARKQLAWSYGVLLLLWYTRLLGPSPFCITLLNRVPNAAILSDLYESRNLGVTDCHLFIPFHLLLPFLNHTLLPAPRNHLQKPLLTHLRHLLLHPPPRPFRPLPSLLRSNLRAPHSIE